MAEHLLYIDIISQKAKQVKQQTNIILLSKIFLPTPVRFELTREFPIRFQV